MAKVLHGIKDIKASGNEIEESVRKTLQEILPSKYHIGQGHIVDSRLAVSKQYDLIISEGVDYTSILKTKDNAELFYYETVFGVGEVKATWSVENLRSTMLSIKHLREHLLRSAISNKTVLSGSAELQVDSPITELPLRNPLFNFAFAVQCSDLHKLQDEMNDRSSWPNIPNLTVILNHGVFALINIKRYNKTGKANIHLFPEFRADDPDYEWRFLRVSDPGVNLAYLHFCLQEHLSNAIVERPAFLRYSESLMTIEGENILSLDEI